MTGFGIVFPQFIACNRFRLVNKFYPISHGRNWPGV